MTPEMKRKILQNIQSPQTEKRKKTLPLRLIAAGACLILVFCFLPTIFELFETSKSLGSDASYSSEYVDTVNNGYYPSDSNEEEMVYDAETGQSSSFLVNDQAKRIYIAYADIESQDYENSQKVLKALIKENDGFIQDEDSASNSYSLPSSSYTIRIPTENYDAFLNEMKTVGNITYSSQSTENITESYYNTNARIASLEKERDRLNALMEKAEDIPDIIAIEEKLMDVEQQLQSWQQDLSSMDLDLNYSTVTINLKKVELYTGNSSSLFSGLKNACSDTWYAFLYTLEDLAILLVYAFPWLLLLIAIAGIVLLIRHFRKKK